MVKTLSYPEASFRSWEPWKARYRETYLQASRTSPGFVRLLIKWNITPSGMVCSTFSNFFPFYANFSKWEWWHKGIVFFDVTLNANEAIILLICAHKLSLASLSYTYGNMATSRDDIWRKLSECWPNLQLLRTSRCGKHFYSAAAIGKFVSYNWLYKPWICQGGIFCAALSPKTDPSFVILGEVFKQKMWYRVSTAVTNGRIPEAEKKTKRKNIKLKSVWFLIIWFL